MGNCFDEHLQRRAELDFSEDWILERFILCSIFTGRDAHRFE